MAFNFFNGSEVFQVLDLTSLIYFTNSQMELNWFFIQIQMKNYNWKICFKCQHNNATLFTPGNQISSSTDKYEHV